MRCLKTTASYNEKTSQLIQMAAAAAICSEGSVHSYMRWALQTGARPEEIVHTIILLNSIIGFPNTSVVLSWAHDILGEKIG